MIKPTIGRVVLYTPHGTDLMINHGDQPMAATVAYVWNDGMVNLAIVDHDGASFNKTSVMLAQDDDVVTPGMCEWMTYQKEQAAKEVGREGAEAKEPCEDCEGGNQQEAVA